MGSPGRTSVKSASRGATRAHSEGTLDNRVPAAAPTALRHLLPARPGTRRHSLEAGKQLCRTSKQGPQTRHCLLPSTRLCDGRQQGIHLLQPTLKTHLLFIQVRLQQKEP